MIKKIEALGKYNIVHIKEINDGIVHRRTIVPTADYSSESDEVKTLCDKSFTTEIKALYSSDFN